MEECDVTQARTRITAIATRLQSIEEKLRGACDSPAAAEAGNAGELARVIQEIAAVRGELRSICDRDLTPSVEASAEQEGLARAISELKSGEFDMQG
jgi:hypothetical protein